MSDINWESDQVASYVSCCYGPEGIDPGDCYTRVGSDEDGEWWADDGDDAFRVKEIGPFASRSEAVEAAERLAAEQDESDGDDDAESMADRRLRERMGESSPRGEWACYWDTALDDSGPRGRYETQEQAEAAVDLRNKGLAAANPGSNLLCGFEVRHLVDGEWIAVGYDE